MMVVVAKCWIGVGRRRRRLEMLGRVYILSCGGEATIAGWLLWRGWINGGVGEARDTVQGGRTACTLTRIQNAVAGNSG